MLAPAAADAGLSFPGCQPGLADISGVGGWSFTICLPGEWNSFRSELVMADLHSRCGNYNFVLCFFFFLSCYLFCLAYSQPSHIGCLPYFHTWCGLSANLECRSEMYSTLLAENTWPKNRQKFAIWALSHNFVRLYLCNRGMYRQSEKTLVKQQYLLHVSSQYGAFSYTGTVTARHSSSGHQSNFAATHKE